MTDPTADYLRAYDDDIDGALELVVRDLLTAGYRQATALRLVSDQADVFIGAIGPRAGGEVALKVADALQVDIIEARDDHVWPRCPEHGTHPLWIDELAPDAMWRCHTTGRGFARLGELDQLSA